jgi:hypothetical protein
MDTSHLPNPHPLHVFEQEYRDRAHAAIVQSNKYWNSQLYFYAGEYLKEAARYEALADQITKHPQYSMPASLISRIGLDIDQNADMED